MTVAASSNASALSRPPKDEARKNNDEQEEEQPLPNDNNHEKEEEEATKTASLSSQKSHTFRQRRLSLSNLQSLVEEATADQNDNQNASGEQQEQRSTTEKTHSFRKRRWSLTQKQQDATEGSASPPEGPRRSQRRRRSSDSSTIASTGQSCPSQQQQLQPPSRVVLTPKTVHAEELVGPHHPPPSPAVSVNNILYQQVLLPAPPSLLLLPPAAAAAAAAAMVDANHYDSTTTTTTTLVTTDPDVRTATTNNGSGTPPHHAHPHAHHQPSSHHYYPPHQPLWKRRYTVREEHKLPFPRNVVGTYSCHGMEPIYDTPEDEEEDDEGEDEAEKINDNGGGGGFMAVRHANPTHSNGAIQTDHKDEEQEDENGNSVLPLTPFQPPTESSGLPPPSGESNAKESEEGEDENTWNQPEEVVTNKKDPAKNVLEGNGEEEEEAEYEEEEEEELPKTMAKINQDRGGIVYPYANCPQTALFAVYDGHGMGGELVSQFALTEIQRRLEKHPCFRTDLPTAFKETFLKVDEALKDEPLIEPLYAGTTACVALLQGTNLTLANVGDSRAVMARRSHYTTNSNIKSPHHTMQSASSPWQAIPLTEDQNPDLPQEAERIIQAGGFVSASPAPGLSARVWLDPDCTTIGLAMSRSIGDHAVAEIGVIAEPVVTEYVVDDWDDFMILASDGVWEFLSSAEAVEIVGQNLHRGATKACQALIEAAAAKWHEEEGEYRDDITAIVVRMQELWKSPAATAAAAAAMEPTAEAENVETTETTKTADKV